MADGVIERLVRTLLGGEAGPATLATLAIDPALLAERGDTVSRAAFAMTLNILLFDDLLARVPSGAAYVHQTVAAGGRVVFDHGALRTIRFADGPTGAVPAGQDAFTRILEPLGYAQAGLYPLPRLRMTGRAYAHRDAPESIPQFFLSELHVDQFDDAFAAAAHRVFDSERDPLDAHARSVLDDYAAARPVAVAAALAALPVIADAFGCHHDRPAVADYEALLAQSAEAAWIATEGAAFNHATDRVADVAALAERLRGEGHPVKDKVEISASGRVRQTALRADQVVREFADGSQRAVPGSFYEFISRAVDPDTGTLDLGFDSGNATGIFAMTRSA